MLSVNLMLVLGALFFMCSGRHLLNSLIMLEYVVLVNFIILLTVISALNSSYLMIFVFFVLTVSSAALGLSLLICVCRTHNKDYFSSFNILC